MSENQTRAPEGFVPDPGSNSPAEIAISGVWVFHESLTNPLLVLAQEDILIKFCTEDGTDFRAMAIRFLDNSFELTYDISEVVGDEVVVYNGGQWTDPCYRVVNLGEEEQIVPLMFHEWLVENAERREPNVKINVTQNGKTTLLTAGKYCDRNVDLMVDVEGDKSTEDGLVTRTSATYTNDRVTEIGAYAFRQYTALEDVHFRSVQKINTSAFYNSTNLRLAEFGSKLVIAQQAFSGCSNMDTLILRGEGEECSTFVNAAAASNALTGTLIAEGTGFIYVPESMLTQYQTHEYWSAYADQIKSISLLEE